MFNKKWFQKWQPILLWFLNTPIVSIWFRSVLCINGNRSSVGKNKIFQIYPNAISWFVQGEKGDKVRLNYEFRTHNKFSKRLYYAFKPLWLLCHIWDFLIGDRFTPRLSLGFTDYGPFYPAAGQVSPVDGRTWRASAGSTWANLQSGAGTDKGDTDANENVLYMSSNVSSGLWDIMVRGIFLFDTSSIPDATSLTSGNFSLWVTGKNDPFTGSVRLTTSNPASTSVLAITDHTTLGTAAQATDKTLGGLTTGQYNNWALNATGLSNVSLTGITKFGIRSVSDANNSEPTWQASVTESLAIYFADQTGTTNDPKLLVSDTVSGFIPKIMIS